jgi:hypothetical protein
VVTDVLVERGDSKVVNSVVANLGAEFSENGYTRLLELSERDDDLATCVGTRPSIPRHHFVKLLSRASGTVKARLQALNAEAAAEVSSAVSEAAMATSNRSATESASMVAAQHLVEGLQRDGKLNADQIIAFAAAAKFEETNAALAVLANVPVALVENMMVTSQSEDVMILAKIAETLARRSGSAQYAHEAVRHTAGRSQLLPRQLQPIEGRDRAAGAALPPQAPEERLSCDPLSRSAPSSRHRPGSRRRSGTMPRASTNSVSCAQLPRGHHNAAAPCGASRKSLCAPR